MELVAVVVEESGDSVQLGLRPGARPVEVSSACRFGGRGEFFHLQWGSKGCRVHIFVRLLEYIINDCI